jgi:hypothetical protein
MTLKIFVSELLLGYTAPRTAENAVWLVVYHQRHLKLQSSG